MASFDFGAVLGLACLLFSSEGTKSSSLLFGPSIPDHTWIRWGKGEKEGIREGRGMFTIGFAKEEEEEEEEEERV